MTGGPTCIKIYLKCVKQAGDFVYQVLIIRMIKSRRMRWAVYVARMGRRVMHIGYWWECQKERDHRRDQDVGGWPILKWILER
jgi:hypothetical protein